jgi:hypothetical protein
MSRPLRIEYKNAWYEKRGQIYYLKLKLTAVSLQMTEKTFKTLFSFWVSHHPLIAV